MEKQDKSRIKNTEYGFDGLPLKEGNSDIVFANAKINIGLRITGKYSGGYHSIETVMYPVPLFDVLEWKISNRFSIETYGFKIDVLQQKSNIIEKAYNLLKTKAFVPPLKICLLKNIPPGAGLGGGSADAAFFVKSLNSKLKLGLNNNDLKNIMLNTGSDCPFFIDNTPAFATGRGEQLKKVKPFLKNHYLFLVFPEININTGNMYEKATTNQNGLLYEKIISSPPANWRKYAVNDFENILFKDYPTLKNIKTDLYKSGALFSSITGSGSAVYGIFDKQNKIPADIYKGKYFTWQLNL